jgi:hypothetical protein
VPIDTGLIIPPKRDEEALIKRPKFGKGEFLSPTDCRCPIGPEWVRQRRQRRRQLSPKAGIAPRGGRAGPGRAPSTGPEVDWVRRLIDARGDSTHAWEARPLLPQRSR